MYKLIYHRNMTCEKWNIFSKSKQILMIANEINRANNLLINNNFNEVNKCYERAFELIDLSVADPKWNKHLKEILRMREILSQLYISKKKAKDLNYKLMKTLISLTPESYNLLN